MNQIKFKPILGEYPEHGFSSKEEEDKFDEYVAQLKKDGKYLTESEEITFNFQKYDGMVSKPLTESSVSNFGIFIPKSTDLNKH